MTRIAVASNELPPHRRPIFERLNSEPGWEIEVFLSVAKEKGRMWEAIDPQSSDLKVTLVSNWSFRVRHFRKDIHAIHERLIHIPYGLLPKLISYRPDVVISTEFGFRSIVSALYCLISGAKFIIWTGDTSHQNRELSFPQRLMRRILIPRASAFLAYGCETVEYLSSQGIPKGSIFYFGQAIDTLTWQSWITKERGRKAAIKAKLGLSNRKVLLSVSHLIPRKGMIYLLHAWHALDGSLRKEWRLVIVGGGPEESSLKRYASWNGLDDVCFLGAIKYSHLPKLYAISDLFVLPTLLDIWGLVVNEALSGGLPAIVSQFAGCAPELVIPDQTGDVVDPRDVEEFSAVLSKWMTRREEIPNAACTSHIQKWNYTIPTSAFVQAVNGALNQT